ncbi:MAG: 50S ribosomal protein L34 [Candidatus Omnitrophica bacterium]|nr:50S ribosomal protein L34 [Candidatus Omnitrophota bacterium]
MKKHLTTPTDIVGKRRHGFLKRMRSKAGRKILSRRRRKGRKRICIS